jgi:hypothetical protein
MLRKFYLTLILLLCNWQFVSAHQDFIEGIIGRNLCVAGDARGCESRQKINLLFRLIQDLNKIFFKDTACIQVQFNLHKYYYGNKIILTKEKYCLAFQYKNFAKSNSQGDLNRYESNKGIVLDCIVDQINTSDCIKLIYYGLKHTDIISQKQFTLFAKTTHNEHKGLRSIYDGYSNTIYGPIDFVKTIGKVETGNILKMNFPELEPLFKQRWYRQWSYPSDSSNGMVDYYIQNDSVYFFKRLRKQLRWDDNYSNEKNWKRILADTNGITLFGFANIKYFTSDLNNNYLVFTNDSTMYHYVLDKDSLIGPLTIHQIPELIKYRYYAGTTYGNNDTLIIPFNTSVGDYNIIYYIKTQTYSIDTPSSETRRVLNNIRQSEPYEKEEQEKIEQKSKKLGLNLKQRQNHIILLFISLSTLTSFLAFSKKP